MATPIQSIHLEIITTTTDYSELNTISIINQSADDLVITNTSSSGNIRLKEGQTLVLTASTGFVLPQLELDSGGQIRASVITS
jgi:hypothetical protein